MGLFSQTRNIFDNVLNRRC